MSGLIKIIKSLLIYREPKEPEGRFELLEDENEGNEKKFDKNIDWQKIEQKARNNDKGKTKLPLKVEQWDEVKNKQKQSDNITFTINGMVSPNIVVNKEYLTQKCNFPKNQDIIIREFNIAQKINAFIIFVDGMADKTTINQFILPQLMNPDYYINYSGKDLVDYISKNVISINQITKTKAFDKIITQIFNGLTALFIDTCSECILIETRGYEKRSIDKPQTEQAVKGSQEGFTENLRTNLTLLRRIIKNENLITEILPVGNTNRINCAIVYLEGITNSDLIKEVKRRLKKIDIDFVMGDGMLEQLIEDNSFMLFPQVVSTERPDRATSLIMEGKVLVLCEGTPFAFAVPVVFFNLFHTSEDYILRWQYGTFLRLVRFMGLLLATLLPGLYIAFALFHQEIIPSPLLASIITTRENVPFPIIIEVLLMEISFELIREGGIRIPSIIGQTLGIVGALILGQAAVEAGLISPMLIIIIAITGLGSFVIPNYSLSLTVRIIRFFFTLLGAFLGFFGISIGITIVGAMACKIKSFGVPYFSPIAPKTRANPDLIIRHPIWKQKIRPDYLNTINRKRSDSNPKEWEKTGEDENIND